MTTTTAPTSTRAVTRRYLVLEGLRWLPTGLLIPILVLLFTGRGFSLTEFGIVGTVMAATTFVLELPTGGLADALGRRRVLVVACGFLLIAKSLLLVVAAGSGRPSWIVVAIAAVAMGVYRALESGPLGAWYVDAMHALDPDADVEAGLGKAGTVTGLAIAAGSLAAGGLMAWDPVTALDPMAIVLAVSLALVVVQMAALVVLMVEFRPALGLDALVDSVRQVPSVIGETLSLVRAGRVLVLLLVVEATWSIGMVAFENLFPVRLAELLGSTDTAAAVLGPVAAAGWAASGAGAFVVVHVSRRMGPYRTGALLRLVQAAFIVAMGLVAGAPGVIAAFIATYLVHGASGPVHLNLLHRQVDAAHRTTALSLNSMVAFATFSMAGIAIGAVADAVSVQVAMLGCAAVTVLGSMVYLAARRADPTRGRGALVDEPADADTGDDANEAGGVDGSREASAAADACQTDPLPQRQGPVGART